jgi:NAD(P)-dependent dehydrogenase (short-subunit alcohol dehydrogenase family)
MTLEFTGKRALVTGSSSGIGAAIAHRLAREGAEVMVHGRNRTRAEAVAHSIRDAGGVAHVAVGDLARADEADHVADATLSALGGVDILVNNAGGESSGGGSGPWMNATDEDWIKAYQGNVVCAVRMVRRFAPGMKETGWGRIIQISSIVAHTPSVVIPDYAASKAALLNMTISLSKTLGGTGITVNSICPGLILTPAVEGWLRSLAPKFGWGDDWAEIERRALKELVPNNCGRIGRPDDIAHAVAYLASPQAGFVTGTDMIVSGG